MYCGYAVGVVLYEFELLCTLGKLYSKRFSFLCLTHSRSRFVMNMHVRPRAIYITRHGESKMNRLKRIGGDSDLSPSGMEYAEKLKEYFDQ